MQELFRGTRHICGAAPSYLKVNMPSQLWALYRFGVGTGRFSVCDFHAANTPSAARTNAEMWSDACAVFCCCLHTTQLAGAPTCARRMWHGMAKQATMSYFVELPA